MKTPDYTRKAVAAYRSKFDNVTLRLDKGLKARAAAVGIKSRDMSDIIRAEVERRENAEKH